jgi:formylglycine-generating enzyme required for sulfatase activity
MMKKCLLMLAVFAASINAFAAVALSNVKIKQRYPWNGKVDILFDLASTREHNAIRITALDTKTGQTLNVSTLYDESGNPLVAPIKMSPGKRRIVWNADADVSSGYSTDSLAITVTAGKFYDYPLYCVVDISGGSTASSYPITYLDAVPEGGWTDEYKTNKIVLRLIHPGVFTQGPRSISWMGSSDDRRVVTLTKPFYFGIFETTQGQWKKIMGKAGISGGATIPLGDSYPQKVWLNDVRGKEANLAWPTSRVVNAGTFLYNLRMKTGRMFEVPTEAQWEYVCKAGSTENEVYIKNYPTSLYEIVCTTVGAEAPNAWGIYDMLGNIAEWPIDKCQEVLGPNPVIDPLGPLTVEGIGAGAYHGWGEILRCVCGTARNRNQYAAHFRETYYDNGSSAIDAGFRVILELDK